MKKLHIGVVGLGLGRHHLSGYLDSEAVGRVVVCDPDARRVEAIRQEYPQVAASYPALEEMLDAESLDAASIVTPDHLHRPHSVACLEAGCHVLQTKPIATNLEDAKAIVQAAEASGQKFMVAHERRFRSRIVALCSLITSGKLGEVIHLRIDAIQDKREQFRHSPWYTSAEAGRTALVGSGIHEVDLLRHLIGRKITSVSAYSNRIGPLEFPKDKTTAAIFQFEGGGIGQVTVTYEAHPPRGRRPDDHFRLIATGGMVMGNRVGFDRQEGWERLPTDPSEIVTGTHGCVHAFLKAILEDGAVPVTGRDAFASLAACVAADTSAESGHPVRPNELT